jgi:hypothetical protein
MPLRQLESHAPYPCQLCYCSNCRKTSVRDGFAINLSGDSNSLKVWGRMAVGVFRAKIEDEDGHCGTSTGERNFYIGCGSALWLYVPQWPQMVHRHGHGLENGLRAENQAPGS